MMDPKIIQKEALIIAGAAGSGNETGKVWEAFMKIQKMHPLKNQAGEESYEIRFYPTEGIGKIYVGVRVQDASVPAEYTVFFLPAATYAEFEILPSKGYEGSNADKSEWLKNNAGKYTEALLNGMKYAVEVYDKRTREQIMTACGRKCQSMNKKITEEMKARRLESASEEEFMATVLEPRPNTGARYERDGATLIQYYTPRNYSKGLRCYCGLMRSLPEGVNASPTYCQCARAFVQVHWEVVLGRQVKVELGATALTGSKECKFIIHL